MTTELTPPKATVRVQRIIRMNDDEVTHDIEITAPVSLDRLTYAVVAAIRAIDEDDERERIEL